MKQLIRQILSGVAIVAFCGCGRSAGVTASSPALASSSDRFCPKVIATSDATSYWPAEPIVVYARIENRCKGAIEITETTPLAMYQLSVQRKDGSSVALTEWGRVAMQSSRETTRIFARKLESGEHSETPILLNRIFDMSVSGDYQVRAALWVVFSDGTHLLVTSELLTLSVREGVPKAEP